MINKYLKFGLFLLLPLFMSSCKDWLDVNQDPNNPTNVAPEFVLPAAQASVAGVIGGDFAIVGGLWAQHWTQSHVSSQYKTLDSYALSRSDYDVAWTELYAGGLNDLQVIRTQSSESGNWNLYLIATATQMYTYQILADFFDKIPMSEALMGALNQTPHYDNGEMVYDQLIASLDEALAKDFDAETVTKVSTDLVFGNLSKEEQIRSWKQFANTLKMKIYLRQTASPRKDAALASLTALLNSGVEFLDKDAAITQFIDEPNRSNPLYENNIRQLNTAGNLRLSNTFRSYLLANGDDERLNALFTPGDGAGGAMLGLEQGNYEQPTDPQNTPPFCPTCIATANMTATMPFYFFSRAEVLFLLAEASLRTGVGNPADYYNAAVQAAYEQINVAFDPSVLGPGGAYEFPAGGDFNQKLKAIMMQKWVAMFWYGYESFFDQKRTGFPMISSVPTTDPSYQPGSWTYSVTGVTGGVFPMRLLYPAASVDRNPNAPSGDMVTQKVWWML